MKITKEESIRKARDELEKKLVKQTEELISIKDDGKGISEEVQKKIFDPFFTTKDVGEGTGLGLAITHGIIEKHGGNIEMKSEVRKGSEFVIKFPIK